MCSILVINKRKFETITVNQYLSFQGKFNHGQNGWENREMPTDQQNTNSNSQIHFSYQN